MSETHSPNSEMQNMVLTMTTISQVSKLSWRAIEQDYSLDKYEEELEKIVRQPRNYTPYIVAIGAGFACGGFCKLFGGDWIAFLLTSICTFIGFRVRARCVEAGLNAYMGIALAAFICTCLAYASLFCQNIRYSVSPVTGLCPIHRTGRTFD